LIDGNLEAGGVGPLSYRFEAERALVPHRNPSKISPFLTLLIFGSIGFYVFMQPARLSTELDRILFAALTLVLFFIWSKGWSPEWHILLIPLLLLSLSFRKALIYIISLSFVNFLEWPLIYQHKLLHLLPITVIARTLIFILLGWELYQQLRLATPARQALHHDR
jgi:hypothetical protein